MPQKTAISVNSLDTFHREPPSLPEDEGTKWQAHKCTVFSPHTHLPTAHPSSSPSDKSLLSIYHLPAPRLEGWTGLNGFLRSPSGWEMGIKQVPLLRNHQSGGDVVSVGGRGREGLSEGAHLRKDQNKVEA